MESAGNSPGPAALKEGSATTAAHTRASALWPRTGLCDAHVQIHKPVLSIEAARAVSGMPHGKS